MAENKVWILESPISLASGAEPVYTVVFDGATTCASPTAKIFQGSTDKTSTNMSGSATASGNVVTLPKVVNLVGGLTYVIVLTVTVDSIVTVKKAQLEVQKAYETQD